MVDNDDLDSLRADVERMRRSATRKISRLKTGKSVVISGTEFDPRRATKAHKSYTRKQLKSYQRELENFLSRKTQFVPDASRRPIPRNEWLDYKKVEAQHRDSVGKIFERMKNVELPSGETVSERLAKMDVLHKQMHNPVTNPFYDPRDRSSSDVTSRESLRKLQKDLKKKSSPRNQSARVSEARSQLEKMLSVINSPEIASAVKSLSQGQFVALWNYTAFASAIAMSYDSAQKMLTPREESWGHEKIRQQSNDAMELISWAKGQPI